MHGEPLTVKKRLAAIVRQYNARFDGWRRLIDLELKIYGSGRCLGDTADTGLGRGDDHGALLKLRDRGLLVPETWRWTMAIKEKNILRPRRTVLSLSPLHSFISLFLYFRLLLF